MGRVRLTTLWLLATLLLLLVLLVSLRNELRMAHLDESIDYVASDAANYFNLYEDVYAKFDLADSLALFLVGSPILFLKLSDGNLFLIQLCQLALMGISLKVGSNCFTTLRSRIAFMVGSVVFPYFLFGFLSVNKEIYAMCAAIFFASYVVRGKTSHLLAALILAMCARYYMLLALVALLFLVPRSGRPRYGLIVAMLVTISLVAPIAKALVPEYSSEGLLDAPGTAGILFSKIIDSFGYALIYPIKYLALIPIRAYSFLIDTSRAANAMEAVVSLASLAVLILSLNIVLLKKPTSALVKRLILIAFVAPMPIMWSEIMHWRYYSFVYFFFLFAVVLHYVERRRQPSAQPAPAVHA